MVTEQEISVHLGARLRIRRRLLDMTQTDVGDAIGVKFQQIQKYESGANVMSAVRLWQLAEVLGVRISYFYEGLEQKLAA